MHSYIAILFAICALSSHAFRATRFSPRFARQAMTQKSRLLVQSVSALQMSGSGEGARTVSMEGEEEESEEETYKREKLAEIKELQDKEVFVERNTGRWECQACGYIYAEKDGYEKRGVPKGTMFSQIENFRCPQCGAGKKYFVEETETLSGFKENLKYGLGGNSLTAGQKSNLIYGGLAIGFAIFMSGYLLE